MRRSPFPRCVSLRLLSRAPSRAEQRNRKVCVSSFRIRGRSARDTWVSEIRCLVSGGSIRKSPGKELVRGPLQRRHGASPDDVPFNF